VVVDEITTYWNRHHRDVLLAPNNSTRVSQVMTRREKLVIASQDGSLEEGAPRLYENRIEKLPLVAKVFNWRD
jgi:hypothetical protein